MSSNEPNFSDAKVIQLLQWLNDSGEFYINPKIQVFEDPLSGRGISLKHGSLDKNEVLIAIPGSHQINFETALNWIGKFNKKVSTDASDITNGVECLSGEEIDEDDPRIGAYGAFTRDILNEYSSFQLICLFILAEWILLPQWSDGKIVSWWKPFFDIFPSNDELSSIPTKWRLTRSDQNSKTLLDCLPTASSTHEQRISELVLHDWATIKPVLQKWTEQFPSPIASMDDFFLYFVHIYFIINSRCLYMEVPSKSDVRDFFTMVPFVDYLNHVNDVGLHCFPSINKFKKSSYGLGEFSIRVGSHRYDREGDEIFLNYGAHSNDFLLAEYGFSTSNNGWNYIDLTPEICSMFTDPKDIAFLDSLGYWQDYTLSKGEISYRTLVAISLLVCKDHRKTEKFSLGYISENYFEPETSDLIKPLLQNMKLQYISQVQKIRQLEGDAWCKRNLSNLYEGYIDIIDSNL
ncbi:unnamed protein product [Kluyveromyces dobzhanskii CBS 2104]|uniref:WGS project CCBQ000000000 data, contig 00049 n=1 Tax=Kluyveromyces dobzhanskii CBS 2104 TaxID=1427455 RepID=A0A0A8L740_9SACH|nr:unnamed protein product [Kluyveromyces dobzhanskii CBS 2104]